MIEFVKRLSAIGKNRTTYRVGLLQDRAYRVLKKNTLEALREFNISSVEWAYIGLVFDTDEGIRLSAAAKLLGVEAPFVTEISSRLVSEMGLIKIVPDEKDKRAKRAYITDKGKTFVEKVESHLRAETRPLLDGISAGEILGYLSVLSKIVQNSEKEK